MIYIHPTATHKLDRLIAIQQATGLTITRGVRYLRLEPGEDKPAPAREAVVVSARRSGKSSAVSSYLQGPFHPGGGDAA